MFTFTPIKTRLVHTPKDEIWDILEALPPLQDGDILMITSKILAIHQGRCVPITQTTKEKLIKQEASYFLPFVHAQGFHVNLTITQNTLIAAAGIDESNADGYFVLWPQKVDELCQKIRDFLCKKNGIKNLGILATDSHTTPLRYGVSGITIGLAGVKPVKDVRGKEDLFGRKMCMTQINEVDALSSMAVLLMGETDEQTPIVLLRGYTGIVFDDKATMDDFKIDPELDLYTPLLSVIPKNQDYNSK